MSAQCDSFSIDFKLFDSVSNVMVCTPSAMGVEDVSSFNKGDKPKSSIWKFGDKSIHSNLNYKSTHIYADPGKYTVTYILETENGCKDSIQKVDLFSVIGPKAHFELLSDKGCVGDSIYLKVSKLPLMESRLFSIEGQKGSIFVNSTKEIVALPLSSAGKHEIQLGVRQRVKDPISGTERDCSDSYPNKILKEPSQTIQVSELVSPEVQGWGSASFTVQNPNDYTSYYWLVKGDTIRTQNIDATGLSNLSFWASNDTCEQSFTWDIVGIGVNPEKLPVIRYDFSQKQIHISTVDGQSVRVELIDLTGQVLINKAGFNTEQPLRLSHLAHGTYIVRVTNGMQVISQKVVR